MIVFERARFVLPLVPAVFSRVRQGASSADVSSPEDRRHERRSRERKLFARVTFFFFPKSETGIKTFWHPG